MSIKHFLFGLALLLLPMRTMGQDDGLLRSQGPLPDDLRLTYEQLCESDLKRNAEYGGGKVKDKEAVRQVSYRIGKLLSSGRILFGDPVSDMLARIADTLLCKHPELRSELRFYTVKSPEVNAFSTAQGMVFVNTGLVAQVENEAQLAFVLAHEIVHYYRHHAMEMLNTKHKKKDIEDERADLDYLLRHHARSREMESEADSIALTLFYLQSPYNKSAGDGIFNILQHRGQTFANLPIDRHFFDGPGFSMGSECWLDSVASITSHEADEDSLSTHPNIMRRRQAYHRLTDGRADGEHYVVTSRKRFQELQRMARHECLRQELIHADYPRAFYDGYLLLRLDSTDGFAAQGLSRALYSVAVNRAYGADAVLGDYKDVEGELQQAYYMLRRIDAKQLLLASIRKIWQLGRRFPHDSTHNQLASHLLYILHSRYDMQASDFVATPDNLPENTEADSVDLSKLPRLERIKRLRERQAATQERSYGTAFSDMISDSAFTHLLSRMAYLPDALKPNDDNATGAQLIYSPTYLVGNSKTGKLKPDKSIRGERRLVALMHHTGKRHGHGSIDFSDQSFSKMTNACEYNDYVTLNEWMTEFWEDKGSITSFRFMQSSMDSLLAKYNARTVNMAVVVNAENYGKGFFSRINAWAMANPLYWLYCISPPVLFTRIFDRQHTSAATFIVDAANARILARDTYDQYWQDDRALVSSILHDAARRSAIRIGSDSETAAEKRIKRLVPGADGLRFALSLGGIPEFRPFKLWPMAYAEHAVGRHFSMALAANYQKRDEGDALSSTLTLRYYFRTDFAPLGRYFGAGLLFCQFSETGTQSNHGGLTVEIGRNYIIARRLIVGLNLRGNYSFGSNDTALGKAWLSANLLTFGISLGVRPF